MSDDLKALFEQFAYGPAQSVMVEFVEKIISEHFTGGEERTINIMELGGGYGRDVLQLSGFSNRQVGIEKIYLVDKKDYSVEHKKLKEVWRNRRIKLDESKIECLYSKNIASNTCELSDIRVDLIYSYQLLHLLPQVDSQDSIEHVFGNCHKLLNNNGIMAHMYLSDRCPLTIKPNNKYISIEDKKTEMVYYGHKHDDIIYYLKEKHFSIEKNGIGDKYIIDYHNIPISESAENKYNWELRPHRHIMTYLECQKKEDESEQ